MSDKVQEIIQRELHSFIHSAFIPINSELKEDTLYKLPDVWRDNFNTIGLVYWTYTSDWGEGSLFFFFNKDYDKICTYYDAE